MSSPSVFAESNFASKEFAEVSDSVVSVCVLVVKVESTDTFVVSCTLFSPFLILFNSAITSFAFKR